MKTKQEIVKQYVASLKEDRELDYIFPLLLERMASEFYLLPSNRKASLNTEGMLLQSSEKKESILFSCLNLKVFVLKTSTTSR